MFETVWAAGPSKAGAAQPDRAAKGAEMTGDASGAARSGGVMVEDRELEIPWIDQGGRRFILRQPILALASVDGGCHTIKYRPLGIYGYGDGYFKAVAEFCEEFAMIWEEYAQAEDTTLTRDAIRLAEAMRWLVKRIEVSEWAAAGCVSSVDGTE